MVVPDDLEAALPAGPPAGNRDVTFLADPVTDNLLRAVVTLAMELSVTRDRMRSLEKVLESQGLSTTDAIEELSVCPDEDAARRMWRERLIETIVGPIVGGLRDAA